MSVTFNGTDLMANGERIHLTSRQLQVFDMLWRHRGLYVRRSTIQEVLDATADDALCEGIVPTMVSKMRRKFHAFPLTIQSAYNLGYRLVIPREHEAKLCTHCGGKGAA